jgi:hypothetical protein
MEGCMSGDGHALRTDKLTLHMILRLGYAAYERSHPLPAYVRRAVWALLACRTAVLGGHVQACPGGHVERIWYNSCRDRTGAISPFTWWHDEACGDLEEISSANQEFRGRAGEASLQVLGCSSAQGSTAYKRVNGV